MSRSRTSRTILASVAGVACVAALVAPPAASADDGASRSGHRGDAAKTLKGTVGPGFTISINKTTVKAGKYKLVVNDLGTVHNFHIQGAGVDQATSVPGTGKTTWKVKLKPGVYTIQCDPHSTTMKTTLTVT